MESDQQFYSTLIDACILVIFCAQQLSIVTVLTHLSIVHRPIRVSNISFQLVFPDCVNLAMFVDRVAIDAVDFYRLYSVCVV